MELNTSLNIVKANNWQRQMVISLLQEENLPVSDLPDSLDNFLIAVDGTKVMGAIGVEPYAPFGLLRSLVVNKEYRNQNIASSLIEALEQYAKSFGIDFMYLLTESASTYFERKGYRVIKREEVPLPVQTSSEFSHVCPQSAVVMMKEL